MELLEKAMHRVELLVTRAYRGYCAVRGEGGLQLEHVGSCMGVWRLAGELHGKGRA